MNTRVGTFGLADVDTNVTNAAVSQTLTAGRLVLSEIVAARLVANEVDTDILKLNGEEVTVTADAINSAVTLVNSGALNPGSGGGSTIVVPGAADSILTSNGSGQLVAPGSALTSDGTLNLVSLSQPKIQFKGSDFITQNVPENAITVGNNSATTTTSAQNNIVFGVNAGNGLGTSQKDGDNVIVGTNANIINFNTGVDDSGKNVVIGTNAILSNLSTSVVIGADAKIPNTDTNTHTKTVMIGQGTVIEESAPTEGNTIVGQGSSITAANGYVTIVGFNSTVTGSKTLPSVVVGSNCNETSSGGAGSVLLGTSNNSAFPGCICLGSNADVPTAPNQLALPAAMLSAGAPTTLAAKISVRINNQQYYLGLYSS